jgi:hypothetical protein
MTKLKLFSMTALLSAAITSPALAQQAVQEPGAAAFYQSLGVGSNNYAVANAFAYSRNFDLSVVRSPGKRGRYQAHSGPQTSPRSRFGIASRHAP